jgi:hypothetical protein
MKIEINENHNALPSSAKEENPFDIDCRELKHSTPMQSTKPQGLTIFVLAWQFVSIFFPCTYP